MAEMPIENRRRLPLLIWMMYGKCIEKIRHDERGSVGIDILPKTIRHSFYQHIDYLGIHAISFQGYSNLEVLFIHKRMFQQSKNAFLSSG